MVLLDVKGASVTVKGVVSLSLVVVGVGGFVVVVGGAADVVVVVGACVELVLTKVVASGIASVVSKVRFYLFFFRFDSNEPHYHT